MYKAALLSGLIVTAVSLGGVMDAGAHGGRDTTLPSFSDLDADGDGQLTMEEMNNMRQNRFQAADANSDGILTREELTAHAQGKVEEHVARMLERKDADGDGALSLEEMQSGRHAHGQRLFERADANSDGAISEEEFEEAMMRFKERHGRWHSN